MAVRAYRDQDLEAVVKLFTASVHQVGAARYSTAQCMAWAPQVPDMEQWRQRLAAMHVLVEESDGRLSGFLGYTDEGHIAYLYTAPFALRQGVASRLFAAAEARLDELGVTSLYTEASLVARPFFAHHGFRKRCAEWVERDGIRLRRYRMTRGPGPFPFPPSPPPATFWERHTRPATTPRARTMDFLKGVIVPVLILIADPGIFRSGGYGPIGRGLFAAYRPFAYLCLGLVLLWKFRLQLIPTPSFLAASVLLAGATVAGLIGILLLPFSFVTILVLGLGLLGLTPFLCAFAWLREGLQQYRAAAHQLPQGNPQARIWLGIAAVLLVLGMGQWVVGRTMAEQTKRFLSGNPSEAREAALLLKPLVILRDPWELVTAWQRMPEGEARDRLGRRIRRLTGNPPQLYVNPFMD